MSSFSSHEAPYKFNNISRDDNIDLSKPLTTPEMMVLNEYEIKVLIQNDEKNYRINTLRLYPIELGAYIYLFNKKEESGFRIPIKLINDIHIVSETVGKIRKKQDLMLFVSYFHNSLHFKNNTNNVSLLIDVDDLQINNILKELKLIHQKLQDSTLWTPKKVKISSTNKDTSINIYPNLPFLFSGEVILWTNKDTQGIINKKTTYLDLVTNYRILQYDYFNHKGTSILMDEIENALVNNQRSIPKTSIIGATLKSKILRGGGQIPKEEGDFTYGDVIISSVDRSDSILSKKSIITIENVDNPSRIASTIMDTKKKLYAGSEGQFQKKNQYPNEKTRNEFKSEDPSNNDNNSESNQVICSKCQSKNLEGSIFCNYCGGKIEQSFICKNCNNENMKGAVFCNQCGNKL